MNQKEKNQLIAEFRILKSLVHPNIVQYYHHEHVAENHAVHLYMEYCGGGDLAGVIRKCKQSGENVSENMVWSVFTQLTLALYRCHYNSDPPTPGELFSTGSNPTPPQPATVILHRDIKPENVFLDQHNTVKLGDFGLAKILDHEHFMANTYVGTPYYMSPEVLLDKPFTPQSDIWSMGCVIYELCAKHPPFQAKTHLQLSQKIRDGKFPPLPAMYSATLSKTIAACLNMNYLQRPTTSTLLRLDVMKLCRKEREIEEARRSIQLLETKLMKEHELMKKKLQTQQDQRQTHMMNQISDELKAHIEQEVERRVTAILKEQSRNRTSAAAATTANSSPVLGTGGSKRPSRPSSPAKLVPESPLLPDTPHLPQSSPGGGRNVKGPRTIRDHSASPIIPRPQQQQHYLHRNNNSNTSTPQAVSDALFSDSASRRPAPRHGYSHSFSDTTSTVIKHSHPRDHYHHPASTPFTKSFSSTRYEDSHNGGNVVGLSRSLSGDYASSSGGHHHHDSEASSMASSSSTYSSRSQSSHYSSTASSEYSHLGYDTAEEDNLQQQHNMQHFLHRQYYAREQQYQQQQQQGYERDGSESPRTTPRERQAPHFQAIYEAKSGAQNKAVGRGVGKGPAAAAAGQQRSAAAKLWDDLPPPGTTEEVLSPFLRRQDRHRYGS